MKILREYAKEHGIRYRAAWNRYKAGKIPGPGRMSSERFLCLKMTGCWQKLLPEILWYLTV